MEEGILRVFEFYEDSSGTLFVHLYEALTGWERSIKWVDFVSRKELHPSLLSMYRIVRSKHPNLSKKASLKLQSNMSMPDIIWYLRKFISYFMARDSDEKYDYIEYTDGSVDINLDDKSCTVNCPIINAIPGVLESLVHDCAYCADASEHAAKTLLRSSS